MTTPLRAGPEAIARMKTIDRYSGPVADWVSSILPPGGLKDALAGTWLGHPVHPLLTDVVVGAWTSAFVLDVIGGERSARAAGSLVGVGVMAAVPTAVTGAADWVDTWGATRRVGAVHAVGNALAATVYGASWLARRRGARGLGVALGMLGAGIVSGTAYLGGHLVYGKGVGVDAGVFDHPPSKWTAVVDESEVPATGGIEVRAGDTEVALFRDAGTIRAIAERCTHRGGPLHESDVTDGQVECPWHGSVFDLRDGSLVRGPATAPQQSFETRVRSGKVELRRRR